MTNQLAEVPIDSIMMEERFRKDMGDLDELKESLRTRGQIQTLAVEELMHNGIKLRDNPEYGGDEYFKLLGGGRRLLAMRELDWEKALVRVYTDLTPSERRSIELHENLIRKQFTWQEEKALVKEIHELMMEEKKEKHWRTNPEGWSKEETANLLGVSRSKVSRDIDLAEALEAVPELAKAKDSHEAENLIARMQEKMINEELAKRAEAKRDSLDDVTQMMMDSYQLGDFFDLIKNIPDESIDLVDLDPDYNIEFGGSINKSMSNAIQALKLRGYALFSDYEGGDYPLYLRTILTECFRVMKPNSWIIMWYAQEPWANDVYVALDDTGFETNRIPLVWNKASDNQGRASSAPDQYLGRQHETAYYARKGSPVIHKRARGDVFTYNAPHHSSRIHPCEKPIELMEAILNAFLPPSSRVLVPFAGSGNALLAAFDNQMEAIGFDLGGEFRDGYVRRVLERAG